MITDSKNMSYANFNITFGKDETPMLEHFFDVIYPAMTSDYKRSSSDGKTHFLFNDVKIIEHDGDLYLIGNFIKNTKFEVKTVMKEDALISEHKEFPTAPHSKFIIFLKNHRMVLIKNESSSPDIRSFQSTLRALLFNYILTKNMSIEDKNKKIPPALVNVINMPISLGLSDVFKNISIIKELRFKFFPLNGDINFSPLAESIGEDMKKLGVKSTYVSFTSPSNSQETQDMINDSIGLAEFRIKAEDKSGNK